MSWIDALNNMFTMPFMIRASIMLVALAVAAGVIGVFINLRGLEFMADGLTHAVFPGIAAGFAISGQDGLVIGALVAAAFATVVLTLLSHRKVTSDTAVAIVLAAMFSLGVVIVSRSRHVTGSLEQLLFGHLFTVSVTEVILTAGICVAALVLVMVTLRGQIFSAFDHAGARAAGYRELPNLLVLNVAIAGVVVSASIAVGNLLVLAILIVPGAVARMWSRGLGGVFSGALIFATGLSLVGLVGAFVLSVTSDVAIPGGAAIAVIFVAGYIVSLILRLFVRRSKSGAFA